MTTGGALSRAAGRRVGAVLASVLLGGAVLAACGGAASGAGSAGSAGSAGIARVAWVANESFQSDPGDTITPVDLPGGTVGSPVATASEPVAMATTDGGRELVVANRGNDTLTVVRTASGSVAATATVGMEPDAVAVAPGGPKDAGVALVADFGADEVTPVDLGTMRAGRPIPVGKEPDALAVLPAAGAQPALALVADFGADAVTPIDLATMAPGVPIPVGQEPDALAVDPGASRRSGSTAGTLVLVADFGNDGVTPISVPELDAGAFIPTPGNPTGIAVAPDGTAWVAGGGTLAPLAPGAPEASGAAGAGSGPPVLSLGHAITLPGVAESVALDGSTTAWVALERGAVVPVDLASGHVGRAVAVGGRPADIVVTPG
jgi:YVTN family beta-propeller protein